MVYIELILIDNFTLDFLLAYLAVRCSAASVNIGYLLLSAFAGCMYALLCAAFPIAGSIPFKLLASALMCFIATGFINIRFALDVLVRFWAVSFVFAGAIFAVACATGEELNNDFGTFNVIRYLVIGGALAAALYEYLIRKRFVPEERCMVEAWFGSSSIIFSAAPDSGTVIKDRGGGGVIIADEKVFSELPAVWLSNRRYKTRDFIINTAGGMRTLKGILPTKLTISSSKGKFDAKAYILIAKDIELNGCRALLGCNITAVKEKGSSCENIS